MVGKENNDDSNDLLNYPRKSQSGSLIKKYVYHLPKIPDYYNNICYPTLSEAEQYCIPALICPGVQKSGTSFFYRTAIRHPKVATSAIKEVNFFVGPTALQDSYPFGITSYASNFINNQTQLIVDVSVKYMMTSVSAPLIYTHMRGVKLLILARDPVDRAYSQYQYQKIIYQKHMDEGFGTCEERQTITFKQYLTEEYNVLQDCGMVTWNHSIIVCFVV